MPTGVYPRKSKYTYYKDCLDCNKQLGKENRKGFCISCAHKRHPTNYWLGKKRPDFSKWQTGRKQSENQKKNSSLAHKGQKPWCTGKKRPEISGEKHWNYRGVTPINLKVRQSLEYKLWRKAVFERDNYTCIWCGDNKGGNLEADHIKPFALFPELRLAIDNGRTLCHDCHKTTDTYGYGTQRLLSKNNDGK